MADSHHVLKLLTLATFLWLLFFFNLLLPRILGSRLMVSPVFWNILYVLLLAIALITTLVVIAESFRREKPSW